MDHLRTRERKGPPMNTDEHEQDEQAVPDDETTEDRDQGEQSRRLSEDRDDPDAGPGDEDEDEDHDGDTFPRPYVERLRARSAGYRTRATAAEARTSELEQALYTERVRALDVLADPTDLPYDPEALDDPDALRTAVDDLVAKRPHLRRRGVADSSTGHREQHDGTEPVSLLGIMRGGS